MGLLDRLSTLGLIEDLTETTWWTDAIFRGLEHFDADELPVEPEIADAPTQVSGELE